MVSFFAGHFVLSGNYWTRFHKAKTEKGARDLKRMKCPVPTLQGNTSFTHMTLQSTLCVAVTTAQLREGGNQRQNPVGNIQFWDKDNWQEKKERESFITKNQKKNKPLHCPWVIAMDFYMANGSFIAKIQTLIWHNAGSSFYKVPFIILTWRFLLSIWIRK